MDIQEFKKYFNNELFMFQNIVLVLTLKTDRIKSLLIGVDISRISIYPNYKDITKTVIAFKEYDEEDEDYYTIEKVVNGKKASNFGICFQALSFSFLDMLDETQKKLFENLYEMKVKEAKNKNMTDYDMLEVILKNIIGAKEGEEINFDLLL